MCAETSIPDYLPLQERTIEVKEGLTVEFKYPSWHTESSSYVPLQVDFKKFMALTSMDLGPMPSALKRWWREMVPRDEYEAEDMAKYKKINRAIHQYGELDMPDVTYPDYEGKVAIGQGRHRLRAFEAAGAETIFVLVPRGDVEALRAAAGINSEPQRDEQVDKVVQPSADEDAKWAEEIRQRREAASAQADALEFAKRSGREFGK